MKPPQPAIWSFSSDRLPPPARGAAICRLRERGTLPLEPLDGCIPHADIVKWKIPGAQVLTGALSGLRQIGVRNDPAMREEAILGVNLSGVSTVCQRRGEITLSATDAILFSSLEEGFVVDRPTNVSFLGLLLPRAMLTQVAPNLDDAGKRVISGQTDALRLLTGYVRCLDPAVVLQSTDLARAVALHIQDLVALAIASPRDGRELANACGARAARLAVIKADIVSGAADRRLTIAAVASRHGITPRYVHKLFEAEGVSFSEYLIASRLAVAHRLLTDFRQTDRSITSIALDAGFADLSYFNRLFRRRYGATPTEVRSLWLSGR